MCSSFQHIFVARARDLDFVFHFAHVVPLAHNTTQRTQTNIPRKHSEILIRERYIFTLFTGRRVAPKTTTTTTTTLACVKPQTRLWPRGSPTTDERHNTQGDSGSNGTRHFLMVVVALNFLLLRSVRSGTFCLACAPPQYSALNLCVFCARIIYIYTSRHHTTPYTHESRKRPAANIKRAKPPLRAAPNNTTVMMGSRWVILLSI